MREPDRTKLTMSVLGWKVPIREELIGLCTGQQIIVAIPYQLSTCDALNYAYYYQILKIQTNADMKLLILRDPRGDLWGGSLSSIHFYAPLF